MRHHLLELHEVWFRWGAVTTTAPLFGTKYVRTRLESKPISNLVMQSTAIQPSDRAQKDFPTTPVSTMECEMCTRCRQIEHNARNVLVFIECWRWFWYKARLATGKRAMGKRKIGASVCSVWRLCAPETQDGYLSGVSFYNVRALAIQGEREPEVMRSVEAPEWIHIVCATDIVLCAEVIYGLPGIRVTVVKQVPDAGASAFCASFWVIREYCILFWLCVIEKAFTRPIERASGIGILVSRLLGHAA